MALYREHGVVLRTIKLGEADRIVTLATEGRGKVRAVAKGVRRTTSRLGARLEPMSHVSLQLYEGRNLDTITQVESIEQFRSVREDLDRLGQAQTLLEAVDAVAPEHEPNRRRYQMLLGALRALDARPAPALVGAFLWKLLAADGVAPIVDSCAGCGSSGPLVAFGFEEGGVLCRGCARGVSISPGARDLLARILGGDLVAVLAEPASPAVHDVEHLASAAFESHVERRLRSIGVL